MTDPVTTPALPSLTDYRVVLFDLDGVITPTADIHMHAWKTMFTRLFAEKGVINQYTDDDYFQYLDGKQRVDGVASILKSRGLELELGRSDDAPTADTVNGVGNRKNAVFSAILEEEGIAAYPGSLALLEELQAKGMPIGIVSSSKNARWVLASAHLLERFPVIVDGLVSTAEGLASKPAPDMFLYAAKAFDVDPADAVVFEDAISGVEAAAAGKFGLVVGVDRGVGAEALLAAGADIVIDDLGVFTVAGR